MDPQETITIINKVESVKPPLPLMLRRFFPQIIEFDTEKIAFDEVIKDRRMAPFVAPNVAGKVMAERGSTLKEFKPAYVKPKNTVTPGRVMKRMPGEEVGGSVSPAERIQALTMGYYVEHSEMLDNRLEWMAMQILRTGKVVVKGEDYPEQTVDYQRDASLDVTLAGTDRWGEADADPIGDLEEMSESAEAAPGGSALKYYFFDAAAWKLFRKDPEVQKQLDKTKANGDSAIEAILSGEDNIAYKGMIGSYALFVDTREYTDEDGADKRYLEAYEVIGVSDAIQGAQAFGAIQDVDVLRPMRMHHQTYVKKDPSARYALSQSAPLPIPRKINATARRTVR